MMTQILWGHVAFSSNKAALHSSFLRTHYFICESCFEGQNSRTHHVLFFQKMRLASSHQACKGKHAYHRCLCLSSFMLTYSCRWQRIDGFLSALATATSNRSGKRQNNCSWADCPLPTGSTLTSKLTRQAGAYSSAMRTQLSGKPGIMTASAAKSRDPWTCCKIENNFKNAWNNCLFLKLVIFYYMDINHVYS